MTRKMLLDKVSSDYVENGINTYLNPYSYHIIRGRKDIVEGVDSFLVDGGALKVIINRLMCRDIKRKSFDMTSMANEIFTLCVKQKKTIYYRIVHYSRYVRIVHMYTTPRVSIHNPDAESHSFPTTVARTRCLTSPHSNDRV